LVRDGVEQAAGLNPGSVAIGHRERACGRDEEPGALKFDAHGCRLEGPPGAGKRRGAALSLLKFVKAIRVVFEEVEADIVTLLPVASLVSLSALSAYSIARFPSIAPMSFRNSRVITERATGVLAIAVLRRVPARVFVVA
jgi:hypothetical protein